MWPFFVSQEAPEDSKNSHYSVDDIKKMQLHCVLMVSFRYVTYQLRVVGSNRLVAGTISLLCFPKTFHSHGIVSSSFLSMRVSFIQRIHTLACFCIRAFCILKKWLDTESKYRGFKANLPLLLPATHLMPKQKGCVVHSNPSSNEYPSYDYRKFILKLPTESYQKLY